MTPACDAFKRWVEDGGAPVFDDHAGGLSCVMCNAPDPERDPKTHDGDCPYRLACEELGIDARA